MHLHLSSSNLWILTIGVAMAVANVIASSRLAPYVARLFAGKPGAAGRPAAQSGARGH